jgi:hypothetical protein
VKSIQTPPSREFQIIDPYLLGIYFSFPKGVQRKLLAKFHQIPCPQKFSIKFSLISTHRNFPEFLFEIHFESEEVSIRTIVPYFNYFPTIFYLEFLEFGKFGVGMNQVRMV